MTNTVRSEHVTDGRRGAVDLDQVQSAAATSAKAASHVARVAGGVAGGATEPGVPAAPNPLAAQRLNTFMTNDPIAAGVMFWQQLGFRR